MRTNERVRGVASAALKVLSAAKSAERLARISKTAKVAGRNKRAQSVQLATIDKKPRTSNQRKGFQK